MHTNARACAYETRVYAKTHSRTSHTLELVRERAWWNWPSVRVAGVCDKKTKKSEKKTKTNSVDSWQQLLSAGHFLISLWQLYLITGTFFRLLRRDSTQSLVAAVCVFCLCGQRLIELVTGKGEELQLVKTFSEKICTSLSGHTNLPPPVSLSLSLCVHVWVPV